MFVWLLSSVSILVSFSTSSVSLLDIPSKLVGTFSEIWCGKSVSRGVVVSGWLVSDVIQVPSVAVSDVNKIVVLSVVGVSDVGDCISEDIADDNENSELDVVVVSSPASFSSTAVAVAVAAVVVVVAAAAAAAAAAVVSSSDNEAVFLSGKKGWVDDIGLEDEGEVRRWGAMGEERKIIDDGLHDAGCGIEGVIGFTLGWRVFESFANKWVAVLKTDLEMDGDVERGLDNGDEDIGGVPVSEVVSVTLLTGEEVGDVGGVLPLFPLLPLPSNFACVISLPEAKI